MVFCVGRAYLVFPSLQNGLFLNQPLFGTDTCNVVISRIHLFYTWDTWDSTASLWPPGICPFLRVPQTPPKWIPNHWSSWHDTQLGHQELSALSSPPGLRVLSKPHVLHLNPGCRPCSWAGKEDSVERLSDAEPLPSDVNLDKRFVKKLYLLF